MKYLGMSIAITLFIYACGTFISLEPNVTQWENAGRGFALLVWFFTHGALIVSIMDEED